MNRAERRKAQRKQKTRRMTPLELRRMFPNAQVDWKDGAVTITPRTPPPEVISSGWVDDDGGHFEIVVRPDGQTESVPVEMPERFETVDDIPPLGD